MATIPTHAFTLPAFNETIKPVLVLGLGNILMQDEGIGVRIAERLLRDYDFPPEVEVLDGGTAGMALYEHIVGRQHVIVIDAIKSGKPPGTLVFLDHHAVPAFFRTKVSPHQLALADILAALKISGKSVPDTCVIGIEPASLKTTLTLSNTVAAQMDKLVEQVLTELQRRGYAVTRQRASETA